MYGLVAAIGFLVLLLRFKWIDDFLAKKNLKKFKPYLAAGLGALSAFFTSLATGGGWSKALMAGVLGILAGFASTGAHQAFTGGGSK
jgi:uncharacterized membrane protein YjjP (DUF1212 family)